MSNRDEEKKKKPVKLEDVAEETGEMIAKGVKKTWDVMKSFGKGFMDTLDSEPENSDKVKCPHCDRPLPSDAIFCAGCGKKLNDQH